MCLMFAKSRSSVAIPQSMELFHNLVDGVVGLWVGRCASQALELQLPHLAAFALLDLAKSALQHWPGSGSKQPAASMGTACLSRTPGCSH